MFAVTIRGKQLYRGRSFNISVRYYLVLKDSYPEIELYVGPENTFQGAA